MAAFQGHDTPFAPGDRVYAEDGDGWRLATVQSLAGHSITLDDGSECAIDELLRWNDIDENDVAALRHAIAHWKMSTTPLVIIALFGITHAAPNFPVAPHCAVYGRRLRQRLLRPILVPQH